MSLVVPFDAIFANETGLLAKHDSWERVELGKVCTILNGFPFKSSLFNKANGFPVVRIRDIANSSTETFYNGDCPPEYVVKKGDLLIGMDGAFRCCEWRGSDAALNQRVCKIRPEENVLLRKFLLYGLNGYLKAIEAVTSSVTVGHLSSRDVQRIPFPLPPLAEQRRIVAKLEALLGPVDACQQRLATIPVLLKRFRQAVLAAACSGRLTADWREENPKPEPARSQIKEERFPRAESEADLPELPETWAWVALGNYGRCFRGKFTPRPRNDPRFFNGKHPFIQIGNLPREGGFVTAHTQTLNDEGLAVSRKFPKGTAVIAIVGATIGNTGVLAYDMCVTDSLVGIETGTPEGNRFVEFFLRHKKHDIRQSSYSSGGQPNIKLEFLNPYPFALPPLPEQQEIVRRVERLFVLADQIEARLAAAQRQVDALTPSLLARAFAGKLVPQDPNDEPAEKLLARVCAARTKTA